jgi:hypothetical protein
MNADHGDFELAVFQGRLLQFSVQGAKSYSCFKKL